MLFGGFTAGSTYVGKCSYRGVRARLCRIRVYGVREERERERERE